jgi:hypothetical protein
MVEGLLNLRETKNFKEFLSPCRFGRPIAGGLEALSHAIRLQLQLQPTYVLIKNGFKNAFNSINKQSIIEVVDKNLPNLSRSFKLKSSTTT